MVALGAFTFTQVNFYRNLRETKVSPDAVLQVLDVNLGEVFLAVYEEEKLYRSYGNLGSVVNLIVAFRASGRLIGFGPLGKSCIKNCCIYAL